MLRYKVLRAVFDRLNTGDNDILQIMNPIIFTWVKVDNTVDIALLVEFITRDTNKLRTLLPGQVISTDQIGQALWVYRIKDSCSN